MKGILPLFGLSSEAPVEPLGSGHIHQTYLVKTDPPYVLQRVNKNVFKSPEIIAANLRLASDHLGKHYPDYPFLRSVHATDGKDMVYDDEGYPWRLFPFRENTLTVDQVDSPLLAFRAAAAFARLTRYLDGVDVNLFRATIPRFHDLSLRYSQFEEAWQSASKERVAQAKDLIQSARQYHPLVDEYERLVRENSLRVRIMHNDTKINNVLFDSVSGEALEVIDLDTLMPGYFIYDLGDMVRTFVSPVSEEEEDYSKIRFRTEVFDALLEGYLSEMNSVMTEEEKKAIPFAGRMMTYIMALRFLADFLRGDMLPYYLSRSESG